MEMSRLCRRGNSSSYGYNGGNIGNNIGRAESSAETLKKATKFNLIISKQANIKEKCSKYKFEIILLSTISWLWCKCSNNANYK
jgi:hypothetical protein